MNPELQSNRQRQRLSKAKHSHLETFEPSAILRCLLRKRQEQDLRTQKIGVYFS